MNKQFKLFSVFFLTFLGLAPSVSAVPLNLPKEPCSKVNRSVVGGIGTLFGTLFGGAVGCGVAVSSPQRSNSQANPLVACGLVGAVVGGVLGSVFALDYWISHSPQGCVNRFNQEYNKFLLASVLRANVHESVWIPGYFNNNNHWPLVGARNLLLEHQINLNKVIDFGRVLMASESVQSLGDDVCSAIARKNDVMVSMLALVKERIQFIQQSPGFLMQDEFKKQFDRMQKDRAAEREYLRIRDELSRLRDRERQDFAHYIPQAYQAAPAYDQGSFQKYVRHCALCSGNLVDNKGYKTSCACSAGRYTYHHECIKTHLSSSQDCPKCHTRNPAVHSDFGDNFVAPQPQQVYVPVTYAPTAPPVVDAVNMCALCSGHIQANKRYRTDCNCSAGLYYYHHECIAGTLKQNGSRCPKCNKTETTVRSAF